MQVNIEGDILERVRQIATYHSTTPQRIIRDILDSYTRFLTPSVQVFRVKVIEAVALVYGVKKERMFTSSRMADIVKARDMAMFILRENSETLEGIGAFFNRNHSTVSHAERRVNNEMAMELYGTREKYELIQQML